MVPFLIAGHIKLYIHSACNIESWEWAWGVGTRLRADNNMDTVLLANWKLPIFVAVVVVLPVVVVVTFDLQDSPNKRLIFGTPHMQ